MRWLFGSPYLKDVEDVPADFQLELVEMQIDSFLEQKFLEGDLIIYYTLLPPTKYPAWRKNALKLASLFGTTFICEHTFSRMKCNKSGRDLLTIICMTFLSQHMMLS